MITSTWRLTEAPAHLTHPATLARLTGTGVPVVDLGFLTTAHLPERGLWEADADELFGRRSPDDDPEILTYCYGVAMFSGDHEMMIDGATGVVDVYDPSGWDHGEGLVGRAFESVAELVESVELQAARTPTMDAAGFAELKDIVAERGWSDSAFWGLTLEYLDELHG